MSKNARKRPKKFPLPKKWRENIEKSGYYFEQRALKSLRDWGFGWTVSNYAFTDPEEGKSRELDSFIISAGVIDSDEFHFIFPIVLVDVKKINLVCFTQRGFKCRYTNQMQYSGIPSMVWDGEKEDDLVNMLNIEQIHHYYRKRKWATQFCEPDQKEDKHKKQNQDRFHRDRIYPLIMATIAEKEDHLKDWHFDPEGEPINIQFYYPILVVENLWECDLSRDDPAYRRQDRVLYFTQYASKNFKGEFFIDICDRDGLELVLEDIERETGELTKAIKKQKKIFKESAWKEAKEKARSNPAKI